MELYQLRTFLAVAEEQNLTRAAEKLFTSQPAVSAQIKSLEDEVGVRLFDRGAKGMKLTRAGEVLREQARRIVDAARDFKHSADNLRGAVSGELVFGVNNRPEVLRLVEILRSITSEHPELSFELVNGSSGVVLQGIEDGSISISFFEGECSSSKVAFYELDRIELCIAAPVAWAEELALPDWKLLETKPWIFVSQACSYSRYIQRISEEQGLQLNRRFQVNEDLTVLNMVAEGLALTVTAVNQIEANGFQDRVVALPHFRASVPLCIGYLAANESDPSIAAVLNHVLRVWNHPAAQAPAQPDVIPFRASGKSRKRS
ncbi:LysR family transcriptional regulator [Luteolibacter sp. GHJ8]|uniref:LysR family transcriptional regulator n=1 Tax=Luteolibacter rhizosphaerae TaxID=2989719 RepID=A0ABT3G5W8_9BACT|nr:LysR family transcriptional regulator [Luteolibacter rhizosphaerae]MCW1915220.1 LysR family transcriptional regulator [Luteolibacter rhizosphaerae]